MQELITVVPNSDGRYHVCHVIRVSIPSGHHDRVVREIIATDDQYVAEEVMLNEQDRLDAAID